MPLDKEATLVRFAESYKTLQVQEGWKNLTKWFELQIQASNNSIYSASAEKFNSNSHCEIVGGVRMIQKMFQHILDTIKEADKIQNKEEGR